MDPMTAMSLASMGMGLFGGGKKKTSEATTRPYQQPYFDDYLMKAQNLSNQGLPDYEIAELDRNMVDPYLNVGNQYTSGVGTGLDELKSTAMGEGFGNVDDLARRTADSANQYMMRNYNENFNPQLDMAASRS